MALQDDLQKIKEIANKKETLSIEEVRILITLITSIFTELCLAHGYDARQILRVKTKLRDAGRRSPPWKPTSSRVPGRPQDGSDGNRILRWKLEVGQSFMQMR